jgi:hypothetical protein
VRQLVVGIRPPDPCALATRINPLAAILALAELDELPETLRRRRARAERIVARARALPWLAVPSEAAPKRFSWPCVPAIVPAGREGELARAGLTADPLGCRLLPELLGREAAHAPRAKALAPLLRRLHLAEPT